MILYYLNIVVLFGVFGMSILLFFTLFEKDSIAYELKKWARLVLKASVIMMCIGQLHSIDGDSVKEITYHDFIKDLGLFGFLFFTHYYIIKTKS